jgi:hypothetical protein
MRDSSKVIPEQLLQDYDIVDTEEELSLYRPLRDVLIFCRDAFFSIYKEADKKAERNQWHHNILTIFAAVFGTIAVLFAIVQLSGFFPTPWPMWVEVIAAIIALLAVLIGWAQARQKQWLLQRHKAERLRLLKFRLLIHPDLWSGDTGKKKDLEVRLQKEAEKIQALTQESLQKYVEEYEIFKEPEKMSDCVIDDTSLKSLVNYYRDKRLKVQMQFFIDRAQRNKGRDKYTRNLPPVCFFLSVLCVLAHFVIDIFFNIHGNLHFLSILLIVLAASLPLLGAGVRTLRSAYEFARSASLFQAKYTALQHLDKRLQEETNCVEVLHALWHCEQFLADEHIEWLRLMIEAEWFG